MNVLAASISPDDPPMAVSARRLTRIYAVGSVQVTGIDGIDLSIPHGQMVVLKGTAGRARAPCCRCWQGWTNSPAGELTVAGHDLNHCSEADLTDFRRNVVGMIFQAFNLLPTLTVLENVCLPACWPVVPIKRSGQSEGTARLARPWGPPQPPAAPALRWRNAAYRHCPGPDQRSGHPLADEPTGNLDSRNASRVMALLADLNRQFNRTVVVATHSDLADSYATMTLRLRDGRVFA
jgi:putative ABC transport system ATP-binding protein